MFKLITVPFVVAGALGSILEPIALKELKVNQLFSDGRIVGGVETDIREIPYQTSLEYDSVAFCGGSLITESHILTTGHCLILSPNYIRVRVGTSLRQKEGAIIHAKTKHRHPDYDFLAHDYDIGILELAERAPLSDKVKPIPVSDVEAPVSAMFRVSGWGKTSERDPPSDILRSVYVPVIPTAKCREMYKNHRNVTSRMICAHDPGKDACAGDSGGPAVVNGTLYGIVSWGVGCARPEYPGVFTNVADAEIRDFIRSVSMV